MPRSSAAGYFTKNENIISHVNPGRERGGFGSDDRAGCALIDILSDIGHSFLITNWEEESKYGSLAAVQGCNEDKQNYDGLIRDELSSSFKEHQFIVALDRKTEPGKMPYLVFYNKEGHSTITSQFKEYLIKVGFQPPVESPSKSDAYRLSQITGLCAVNMSIGYNEEHYDSEKLDIDAWYAALQKTEEWLRSKDIPRFEL